MFYASMSGPRSPTIDIEPTDSERHRVARLGSFSGNDGFGPDSSGTPRSTPNLQLT
jgi:hypothetical protein